MTEYVKTTWETGDIITAEKLNNVEDGIKTNETNISLKANSSDVYTKAQVDTEFNEIKEDIYTQDIILVGSVTNNNGVLSNFSTSNYAKFPFLFNPGTSPWKWVIKLTTDNDDPDQNILEAPDVYYVNLWYNNNSFGLFVAGEVKYLTNIQTNTTYYLTIEFTGSSYIFGRSSTKDGVYDDYVSFNSSTPASQTPLKQFILGASPSTNTQFNGTIDLNDCYFEVNGNVIWTGASNINFYTKTEIDTYLNGKADKDLSNLSTTGQNVIDGQYVDCQGATIIDYGPTTTGTTGTVDLSSYLPTNNCLCTFTVFMGGTNSSNDGGAIIATLSGGCGVGTQRTLLMPQTTSNLVTQMTVPVINKTLSYTFDFRSITADGSVVVYFQNYRRLGTNA